MEHRNTTQINGNGGVLSALKKYWFLVVVVFVAGGFYYSVSSATSTNANRIQAVADQQHVDEQTQSVTNTQISTSLAQIQTDLAWIKGRFKQ